VGVRRKLGRQCALRCPDLSVDNQLREVQWRRAGRTFPSSGAEENCRLRGPGCERVDHRAGAGHALQLDGHAGSVDIAGVTIDDWESDAELPITTFFALGYEHSIVNMYVIPTGMLLGAPVPLAKWWLWNQIPVTLGNIISATLFTGLPLFVSYYRKPSQAVAQARLIDRPAEVAAAS
jgi:Formate/nitrite transporter